MTKRRALIDITLIWICSAFFASPTLLYSRTIIIPYDTYRHRVVCLLEWPDGISVHSNYEFGYNIAFLLLTYVIPMATMAIAYTRMGRVLWDSRLNELNCNIQSDVIRNKQ
ncbi:unnamed protein product, partial [Medioppia subpectinata]